MDTRRGERRWHRLWVAIATGMALVVASLTAVPAATADDPWLTLTDTPYGVFARWTIPNDQVTALTGSQASQVVARGSFGPSDNWAQVNLPRSGANWTEVIGPLEPGLYHYQLTADDTKNFGDPTNPNTNEVQPTWRWFYVPGPEGFVLNDVPEGVGGTLHDLTYQSTVAGESRTAVVWTPPGYDADREEPYPVFYLQHGGAQSYRDWTELGRAKQIFDNLTLAGKMEPMVVVMGNGNVGDFQAELLQNIVPAVEGAFHITDDPERQALAGLSLGGLHSLNTLFAHPGRFAYIGSFQGFLFGSIPAGLDVDALNASTTLLRLYVGNPTDLAYNLTHTLLQQLDDRGIAYEFDGVNPKYGHNWNAWQEALVDFAQRLFRDVADHGMSPGHLPLTAPYSPPPAGTVPQPSVTMLNGRGVVSFETSEAFSDADTVTVWANWGPSHNWTRVEMSKSGNRWRATVADLEPGFYYYRYMVNRVAQKDTQNPTSVTSEPTWSTFVVPGHPYVSDVAEGEGGTLETFTFAAGAAQRTAYVWTPPGYDPERETPYPLFVLNHGGGQSYTDWPQMGRAKQILDNLYLQGQILPMVVVMPNGNVGNFTNELLNQLIPAARNAYNITDDPEYMAIAGLSAGGARTNAVVRAAPGVFSYVGTFTACVNPTCSQSGYESWGPADVDPINAGTKLLRLYTGNIADFAHNAQMAAVQRLTDLGFEFEFAGVSEHGHNWNAWQENLVDFAPRLFKADTSEGIPIEGTIPEGENGVLALTIADFGASVVLSEATNVGDRLRLTGALPEITVSDSRTAQQAGLGGWAVTGQADAFVGTSRTLPADHLGWTPEVLTPRDGIAAGPAAATAMAGGTGLATPAILASADAEGRFGSARLGAQLLLEVPVDTPPGTYTGLVTVSLFPLD